MFPSSESNGFMKKMVYNAQGLAIQEVFFVHAVCTMLLCFGCSFPQINPLQIFSLPALGSVWILSSVC